MEIVVLKSAFFLLMLCVYILEVDGLFLNNLSNDIRIQRKSPEDVDNGECVLYSLQSFFMHWISPSSLKRKFFSLSPLSPARSQHSKYSQHFGIFCQRAEPMACLFSTEIKAFQS